MSSFFVENIESKIILFSARKLHLFSDQKVEGENSFTLTVFSTVITFVERSNAYLFFFSDVGHVCILSVMHEKACGIGLVSKTLCRLFQMNGSEHTFSHRA